MEREVGGGIGMGNTCKPMAVLFQCMTKFTTNKTIKKKKKKKKKEELMTIPAMQGYCKDGPGLSKLVCPCSSGVLASRHLPLCWETFPSALSVRSSQKALCCSPSPLHSYCQLGPWLGLT